MKRIYYLLSCFAFIACENNTAPQKDAAEIEEDSLSKIEFSEVEKLATDFVFTEGPATDNEGNVYFTDIPEAKIYRWNLYDELELFKEESGGANGLFFDTDNKLFICEGYTGKITSISDEGVYEVLAESFNENRFNQPNDVWVHPNGDVYFTDPYYGSDATSLPQNGMHVYRISSKDLSIQQVTEDLVKPNGLIGTPDGKTLYITDHGGEKTFVYNINEDGGLSEKKQLLEVGGDGMTLDEEGNIYLTTDGKMAVEIFSPNGEMIASINFPEQPSNVTFGGKNRNELYVTARTSIYRVKTNQKGAY